jgi:hypothetical protein
MKQAKEIKLHNVYYNYDNSMNYETTTDNFEKWLEQHNKQRIADNQMTEHRDEFEVQEVSLILFDEVEDEQAKDN